MSAVISWDNYCDDGTVANNTNSVSPIIGSEALSVQNLLTRQLGDIFRFTFTAQGNLLVDFDLGSAKEIDLIGILGHNLQGYTYSILFGTTPGGSEVGTEGPNTFWQGTSEDPPREILYLSSSYTARYVRLNVTIPATSPWENVNADIGRVWLDKAWARNVSMDYQLGTLDPSKLDKSKGGSAYSQELPIFKTAVVRAFGLTDEAIRGDPTDPLLKSFMTMDLAVGTHGEILFLPKTSGASDAIKQINRQRLGIYGHISTNGPIKILDNGADGFISEKRFVIEEDL